MPEFQFLTTLTVNAPSEAAAQTQADHAIEDADQYLSDDYKLERGWTSRAVGESIKVPFGMPRYTVELTTEGWQVKDGKRERILADSWSNKRLAQEACERYNALKADGDGVR